MATLTSAAPSEEERGPEDPADGGSADDAQCFGGNGNYKYPSGRTTQIKDRLQNSWAWDMIYGQIMVKTLVSWAKSSGSYPEGSLGNIEVYRAAFTRYNGDTQLTLGVCTEQDSVPMMVEYGCSVIAHFQRMSAQWSRFNRTGRGQDVY